MHWQTVWKLWAAAYLTVVQPQSHVLLFDAESLGQVQVDVSDGGHATEAACVGQNPLQRSVGGGNVTCWGTQKGETKTLT